MWRAFTFTSFRRKLLTALVGLVALLLIIILLMLERETDRQIELAVAQTSHRSNQAFGELEELWLRELSRLSMRFTDSTRMPGALEAALEEDEPQVLVEAARYELTLAGMEDSLAVFADAGGRPVIAMLGGERIDWTRPLPTIAELAAGDEAHSIYRVVGDRLFVVEMVPLGLFGRYVGSVMLGTPLDQEAGRRLAEVVGAEIGFVADARTVIATPGVATNGLLDAMLGMAGCAGTEVRVLEGRDWALVAAPLSAADPHAGTRVVAAPLTARVAPFERLQRNLQAAGGFALLLAIAIGVVIARSLSAPVRELKRATDRVADGELDFRVEVRSRDELGRLADAFNQMLRDLSLKEKYRSLLDKVVSREIAEEMLRGEIVLGGETREVTVLFADIRGFTALTEGMAPAEVISLLNEFMDRAATAIEAEGGVVDKYVGDQIMAVFGAPVGGEQDALRALRAAMGIRRAMAELNASRVDRGKPPVAVGIGVNTGEAVAGNMGSRNRLNYTVLGESVNLASRLCDHAAAGQILISEATRRAAGGLVATEVLDELRVKGLSYPVLVHAVMENEPDAGRGGMGSLLSAVLAALLWTSAVVAGDGPSSLADLGVGWRSSSGGSELTLSGRLMLEGYFPGDDPAWLIAETDAFAAAELSLFADLYLGAKLLASMELRVDRGETPTSDEWDPRVEQLFLRYAPWREHRVQLQLGRFVSPFGAYPQRHDTVADPFIRPPLPYEHRTMICPTIAPSSMDGFLYWKERPEVFRPTGAPVVWGAPYQIGAMVAAAVGPVDGRLALMNSAPSSPADDWNYIPWEYYDPSWVAHLGYTPAPGVRFGLSYDIGPYSETEIADTLPPGSTVDDYDQELWGLELSLTRGWTELRAELFHDRWEVPNLAKDPEDVSWYVELKQKVTAGAFVAARYGEIHFRRLPDSGGELRAWDYDVRRWQVGAGYRIARGLELKGELMWNSSDEPTPLDNDLVSVQLRWEF